MNTTDQKLVNIVPEYGSMYPAKKQRQINRHVNQGLEMVYLAKGQVTWEYEGETVTSKAGTLSFSWPGQFHGSATSLVPASEMHWIIVKLEGATAFHADLSFDAKESRSVMDALSRIKPQIIKVNPQIEFYFREVIRLLNCSDETERWRQVVLLVKLLLIRVSKQKPIIHNQETMYSATKKRVKEFLFRLEKECALDWTLQEMCGICGVARTRFAVIVKELTGESPIKTLNRFRINRARNLLSGTDRRITDIAFACGFSSSQNFSAVFKAYNGMTPREFRGVNQHCLAV